MPGYKLMCKKRERVRVWAKGLLKNEKNYDHWLGKKSWKREAELLGGPGLNGRVKPKSIWKKLKIGGGSGNPYS